jgi:hypothetical protein
LHANVSHVIYIYIYIYIYILISKNMVCHVI